MKAIESDEIYVALTESAIDIQAGYSYVNHPECGGIASFVGTTRSFYGNRKVSRLEYEAYEGMALLEMERICKKAKELSNGSLYRLWVVHRIGVVPVQEASIAIYASSPHRKEALDGVNFIIDEVKSVVPIWKKEFYDGFVESSSWKTCQRCLVASSNDPSLSRTLNKLDVTAPSAECDNSTSDCAEESLGAEWKMNTEWSRPDPK